METQRRGVGLIAVVVAASLCCGCGNSEKDGQNYHPVSSSPSPTPNPKPTATPSIAELRQQHEEAIKRERLARKIVIGKWVSQYDKEPVVFDKNGNWQHGLFKGKWTFDATDEKQINAKWGSENKGSWGEEHYWLENYVIIGIRGGFGNPRISYRKVKG